MSNGANLEKATPTKGRVALLVVVVGGDGIHAVTEERRRERREGRC